MVDNGIECGIMAAYAEEFDILEDGDAGTRQQEPDAETAPLEHPWVARSAGACAR
jgi:6-phosphogluconate dehydrogenase